MRRLSTFPFVTRVIDVVGRTMYDGVEFREHYLRVTVCSVVVIVLSPLFVDARYKLEVASC